MRQRAVGIALARILRGELGLGPLFIGIGPVENLLLDELAGGKRLERGAGQIEIGPRGDRQELGLAFRQNAQILVHVLKVGGVFETGFLLGDGGIFALEKFLGRLAPRAEMVFIEHDQIPICRVDPFVPGFDVPRFVTA